MTRPMLDETRGHGGRAPIGEQALKFRGRNHEKLGHRQISSAHNRKNKGGHRATKLIYVRNCYEKTFNAFASLAARHGAN